MAVTEPSRGTPIDANLLSQYAQEINKISGILANTSKMSTVVSPPLNQASETRSVITPELSFHAGYISVTHNAAASISHPAKFGGAKIFAITPIVVATVFAKTGTASVELINATTAAADFRVTSPGAFTGYINYIAIGVSDKML
jgi:hypothetical protein